jgi:hypothetical protein
MIAQRLVLGILFLAIYSYLFIGADQAAEFSRIAKGAIGVAQAAAPTAPVSAPSVNGALGDQGFLDKTSGFLAIDKTVAALDALESSAGSPAAAAYERSAFGTPWADVDGNSCSTRNDILNRDLRDVTHVNGTCVVVTGKLTDPYTGKEVIFDRSDASAVPIDHVLALSWAWENGASTWSDDQRLQFANDPLNLSATTRSANSSKSDRGPSEWRPDNEAYRCEYITRFVFVATTYKLTIGDGDRNAARRGLAACD